MSQHIKSKDDDKDSTPKPQPIQPSSRLSWWWIALIVIVSAILGYLCYKYYVSKKVLVSEPLEGED